MENAERFCRKPNGKIVFFARKSVGMDSSYPCQHLYGYNASSFPRREPKDIAEQDVWQAFAGMAGKN